MEIPREDILNNLIEGGILIERAPEEILAEIKEVPYEEFLQFDKGERDTMVINCFKKNAPWIAHELLKKGYNLETRYKEVEEDLYRPYRFHVTMHYSITNKNHPERARLELAKGHRRITGRLELEIKKIDNSERQGALSQKELLPYRNLYKIVDKFRKLLGDSNGNGKKDNKNEKLKRLS